MWKGKAFLLLIFLQILSAHGGDRERVILKGDHGDPQFDKMLTKAESGVSELRDEIKKVSQKTEPLVAKSPLSVLEVKSLKETLLLAPAASTLSGNLTETLKALNEKSEDSHVLSPYVGMMEAEDAIADPSINVIDSHVSQIIKSSSSGSAGFQPNLDEMKILAKQKHRSTNMHNLYRENLQVDFIREETKFKLGNGIDLWKVLKVDHATTALFGRSFNIIAVLVGQNDSYAPMKTLEFEGSVQLEALKVWDNNQGRIRNLLVVANNDVLIWHELLENDVVEIARWNLLKLIESVLYFTHDGNNILLVNAVDESGKVQAEFIEFNVPDSEFWVIQAFTLPSRSPSVTCLDLGRDMILAFVQNNSVSVYRHHFTKHLRGKFSLFKTIEAANVSTVSGFRIGGHSYLAVGGNSPKIFRYVNGDFVQQTILSQTFGFVEQYMPVPIRTYRDDLILLVQHRLRLETHTLSVVDALIWNGIAFDNALSVPCQISADPNANGFTCMLDLERDEGLLGAAFIHHGKENALSVIVPRHEAHSGMFTIKYSIVDTEDPLLKEMDQIKKSIELINQMLEYEDRVKKEVDEALAIAVNPRNEFSLENLNINEIETEFLELGEGFELNSNAVEFLDSTWTQDDFLVNLDELEKMVAADEAKLKAIDKELNKLNRINRAAPDHRQPRPDSDMHNLGVFPANGQFDIKTMQVTSRNRTRSRRQTEPIDESRVETFAARNIELDTVNGIPVSDLIFLENGQLELTNITFLESVEAENVNMLNDGRVNGIKFSQDVLAIDSPNAPTSLLFENIFVHNLEVEQLNNIPVDSDSLLKIEGPTDALLNLSAKNVFMRNNLKVESINGIDWNKFFEKMVPKHLKSNIDEVNVNGDVWIIGEFGKLNAVSLNGLPFPEGYVLKAGKREPTAITGKKNFVGILATEAIDTDGKIDGISPLDIITLDQPQQIAAETTFRILEVMRKLEVNGTIAGQQLDEFLPNPTLEEVKEISAACSFKELIVEGTVKIDETLNGQNLETLLSDVVYEAQEAGDVVMSAPKVFSNLAVKGDVAVASNFVNDQDLDNFAMTDQEQTVNIREILGDVFISNLKLTGRFDGINATDLEHSSVRTFGDQFIETPIMVAKGLRAEAATADIKESLNGVAVRDFLFTDQPITLTAGNVILNDLKVVNLKLQGNVVGPGSCSSLNVSDLSTNHMSKSLEQIIAVPVKIKSLTTNGTFFSKNINGIVFDDFIKYMKGIRDFKSLILSGEQRLDNLIVDGNINLKSINERNFAQLVENAIWLNKPNIVEENLKFLDDVTVQGDLTVKGTINKKVFNKFAENWISNQENPINIQSDKTFAKDVIVESSLETEEINGIQYEDLLMNADSIEVQDLTVIGNVNVQNLTVEGIFNQKLVKSLEELYSYDSTTYAHSLTCNVHFNHPTYVDYLNTPMLNKVNVEKWFANLIRADASNVTVNNEKIFLNEVVAQQGFSCKFFNEINMNFLGLIIINSDTSSVLNINSDLVFSNDVYAQQIAVKTDLYTRFISNCDTIEWLSNGFPLDQDIVMNVPLHVKSSALKVSKLTADYFNGVPVDNFFTLKTNQTFDHEISVAGPLEVKNPLRVTGLVNGFKIEHERENTVMRSAKDQVVTLPTNFGKTHVYDSLTTHAKVNSKSLQNIVLLDSSPTIESAVNFNNLRANSLHTNDLISRKNFDKWYENVLWCKGRDEQTVSGVWKAKKLRLTGDTSGNGMINDMPINEIENNLKNSINAIDATINNHSSKYKELCLELEGKANESKGAVHILKYLELDFKIEEPSEIFSHFAFKTSTDENLFAVNTNCTTQVYKWNKPKERMEKISQTTTGVVYDWITVKNSKGDTFIITNSRMEPNVPCPLGGINVWKMSESQMFHVNTIPTGTDVVELHSNPDQPGRFYTLNSLDVVEHFDVFGERKELWNLPLEHFNYSFVPPEVTKGLTLYNGRKLFSLESNLKSRQRRFFDSSIMNFEKVNRTATGDSAMYRAKMPLPDFTKSAPSIPSIPSTPLKVKEDLFLSKLRTVGDAIQNGINNKFKSLPKLTITNSTVTVIKANEGKMQKPNSEESTTSNQVEVADAHETTTPTVTSKTSSDNKTKSLFVIKPPKEETKSETGIKGFLHKIKSMGEGVRSALSFRKLQKNESSGDNIRDVASADHQLDPQLSTEPTEDSSVANKSSQPDPHLNGDSTKQLKTETRDEQKTIPKSAANRLKSTTKNSQWIESSPVQSSISTKSSFDSSTPKPTRKPSKQTTKKILHVENQKDGRIHSTTKFPVLSKPDKVELELEQQVPHEVLNGSGIRETENQFFPERGTGEFVMMYVGPRHQKRELYAVTRNRDSIIKGNHNIIEVYNDIFEGSIYQYIPCSDPSNLVALQFNDETLFAFLDNREILIYTYQGVQGFVGYRRIKLPAYALQMTSLTLPPKIDYKCDNHYLVVRMESEILFYEVKISGNCGLSQVQCGVH